MRLKSYMSNRARVLAMALTKTPAIPLRLETVEQSRENARQAFAPRAERAVSRTGVDVTPCEIAQVPCLDIRPEGGVYHGCILYCYGGGYVTGSPHEDLIISAELSARTGARVVSVGYRLAPENPWPAAMDDGRAVYDALAGQEPALALAGESAGGNLALVLMQQVKVAPRAVMLMSPWSDLTHTGDSLSANEGRDPSLPIARLQEAAEAYARDQDPARPEISPIHGTFSADGPPVLITTGTRDLLLSQCAELSRRMRQAGQAVELCVFDGMWHVFEFYDELPEAEQSLATCSAFLKGHLQGSP